MAKVDITTPVGRIVGGSIYEASTTNRKGEPLVYKNGADKNKPRSEYWFTVAIPKTPADNGHWANTPWGQQIWGVGHAAHPLVAGLPGYSWKVSDGDDTSPNPKSTPPGKRNCDIEGWAGNWIVRLKGGIMPKVYQLDPSGKGLVQIVEPGFAKPGHYAQVFMQCEGNGASETPGVYLNPVYVLWRAFGKELSFGPSLSAAQFDGSAPLPPGASAIPLASSAPAPSAGGGSAQAPAPGHSSAPAAPGTPPAPTASAAPVAPAPSPGAGGSIPAHLMTAKAAGVPYTDFIAKGWTDAALIADGYMVAAPAPLVPGGSAPAPSAPAPAAPAPTPVSPAPQFLTIPQPGGAPAAPAPGRQMTAKAAGVPYANFIANGWDDVGLVQNGYMLA